MGFLIPSEGSLSVEGINTIENPVEAKKIIGYLPGDPQLPQNLNSKSLFKLGADMRGQSIDYAMELAEKFELEVDQTLKELSKGNRQKVALILGDNFFYGQNLTSKLIKNTRLKKGAKVVLHKVTKPDLFGVAKINKNNKIISIKEKPKKFLSDLAITGLYFFDNNAVKFAKKLKPSKRGEVELVDMLNIYRLKKQLTADLIGRGGAWLDTGSIEDFYKTSAFVSAIENRQGFKIACLEEVSLNKRLISKKEINKS